MDSGEKALPAWIVAVRQRCAAWNSLCSFRLVLDPVSLTVVGFMHLRGSVRRASLPLPERLKEFAPEEVYIERTGAQQVIEHSSQNVDLRPLAAIGQRPFDRRVDSLSAGNIFDLLSR